MKRGLTVIAATVLMSLGLPVPAAWGDDDDLTPGERAYVAELAALGVDGPAVDIVRVGWADCNALSAGMSPAAIVAQTLAHDDDLTPAQAWATVRYAQRDICGGA
jgi:hypothetical protein